MAEAEVQNLRKRRKQLLEEQERIQKELDGLRKPLTCNITVSSDEEFERGKNEKIKETDESEISEIEDNISEEIKGTRTNNTDSEIDDNISEVKNPCTNTNTFLSHKKTKRLINSKLDDVPLRKKKKIAENLHERNIHFMVQQNNEEASTSKASGSFSFESIHEKLTTLTERIEQLEERYNIKKPNEASITLSEIKSKNITSKSAFIALRDVWIPDILKKINETKSDIISKINDLNDYSRK